MQSKTLYYSLGDIKCAELYTSLLKYITDGVPQGSDVAPLYYNCICMQDVGSKDALSEVGWKNLDDRRISQTN